MAVHLYTVENEVDVTQNEISLQLTGQFYSGTARGTIISNNGLVTVQITQGSLAFRGNSDATSLKPGERIYFNPLTKQACFEPGPIKNS